jgi:hypothetical protein
MVVQRKNKVVSDISFRTCEIAHCPQPAQRGWKSGTAQSIGTMDSLVSRHRLRNVEQPRKEGPIGQARVRCVLPTSVTLQKATVPSVAPAHAVLDRKTPIPCVMGVICRGENMVAHTGQEGMETCSGSMCPIKPARTFRPDAVARCTAS